MTSGTRVLQNGGMKSGCRSPLAPTNLCCWEKCAYSGCPIHATEISAGGSRGHSILTCLISFSSLTFLRHAHNPYKNKLSFEYHCLLMKPSHLWKMRYLSDTLSKGHLLSMWLGTQTEILACYFGELKKKKVCKVLANILGIVIPIFMHYVGFGICSRRFK